MIYAVLRFPTAGTYTFEVAHDDQVEVDFSSLYAASTPANYRNYNYNIPVGSLQSYTSDDATFESLPGNFVIPQANTCYVMRIYWNNVGNKNDLRLGWTIPGATSSVIVPSSVLSDPSLNSSYSSCANFNSDIGVSKTAPAMFASWGPTPPTFDYTIRVWNYTSPSASGVTVADTFPSNVTVVSTACTASGGAACAASGAISNSGQAYVFKTGTLPANNSAGSATARPTSGAYVDFTVTVRPTTGTTTLTNTATLTVSDTNASNNTSSVTTVRQNPVTLTKSGPATAIAGQSITYSFNVTNGSPNALSAARVIEQLPAGMIATAVSGATCGTLPSAPGALLTCQLASAIAASAVGSFSLTVRPTQTGSFVNYAMTDLGGGANTGTPSATCDTTTFSCANAPTVVTAAPNVTLSKAFSPTLIASGGASTLAITVSNAGSASTLTGLAFSDSLPANVVASGVLVGNTCGGAVSAPSNGTTVSLSGGALAAGASCVVQVQVTSATSGSYTNTIAAQTLTTSEGATNAAAASAILTVRNQPRLTVAKNLMGRAASTDQFTASISGGGPSVSTSGSGLGTVTSPVFAAVAGTTYTFSEAAAGSPQANLARYSTTYSCTNAGSGGTPASSGSGTSVGVTPQLGDDIICTFTNTPIAPKLSVAKSVAARLVSTDQFTVAINGGPSVTTTGAQTSVNTGAFTAAAGTAYLLSEVGAGTPTADLARYTTTYSCTNAGVGGTTISPGASTSFNVTPQAGDDLTCTFTNTPVYPKVTATKSASPTSFTVGATGQIYQISITVANGRTLAPITIADTLPAGITLSGLPTVTGVGASLSGCSSSGSSLGASCQLSSDLPNGTYVVTVPVNVALAATTAGAANTANLGGGGDPACTVGATNETCDPSTGAVPVKTGPSLTTTKALTTINASGIAKPDETLVYTLTVSNGGGTAGSTVLTETVPAGTSYSGSGEGWSCAATTPGSTCTQTVTANAGSSASVSFTVKVNKPGTAASITNTVTSSAGSCTSCTVTTAAEQADMQAVVTGVTTGETGTPIVLTSTCKNNWLQVATNASCTVTGSATTVPGAVTTCTPASPQASLIKDASIVCTTTFTPTAAGTYTVTAVTGADQYDPNTGNNSQTHSVTVNTPAALAVVKTLIAVNGAAVPANYAAQIGDKLTYDIAVSNTGGTAGSTMLTETVPAGTSYIGAASAPGEGWSTAPAADVCDAAASSCKQSVSVAAQVGSTVTTEHVKFTVQVQAPMTSAAISNTVASDAAGSCTASSCTAEVNSAVVDMTAVITQMPSAPLVIGSPVQITGVCTNKGPVVAVNASCDMTVNTVLKAGVPVSCDAPKSLAVNETLTCQATLTPMQAMNIVATVVTKTDSYETNLANNTDTKSVDANTPSALTVVKSLVDVNGAAVPAGYLAKPGDTLRYQLMVTNSGGTAGSTTLTETVPVGTSYVGSAEGWGTPSQCLAAGSSCTQLVAIAAATAQAVGTASVSFTVKVADSLTGASIVNTVTSSEPGSCAAGCVATTPTKHADVAVTTPTTLSFKVGDEVKVVSVCTNAGPVDTLNASCVVSGAPAGATTVCTPVSPVASLVVGASITCTTTFKSTEITSFVLTTTATHSLYDAVASNNVGSTTVVVGNAPLPAATPVPVDARWALIGLSMLLLGFGAAFRRKLGK